MKKTSVILSLLFATVSITFAATNQQQMQLKLVDQVNGLEDLTLIYFASGTATTFVYPQDVEKSIDTAQDIPQLYSFSSDNIACYTNGYGNFAATTVVALGIKADVDTTYALSLAGSNNFDPSTLILLEDRQLGTFTNLRTASYTINISQPSQINNRFFLHVTFPPVVTTTVSGCGNNTGIVTIAQDSSVQWSTCTLFDSASNPVKTYTNVSGNISFGSLPEGTYSVMFNYNSYLSSKTAQVDGHHIEVSVGASAIHASVGEEISFFSNSLNTTDYQWQFGDSSVITGVANPTYAYTGAGNYVVTLTASNSYGCSVTDTLNVDISVATAIASVSSNTITITNDNNNLKINITDVADNNYNYQLYNMAGQILRTGAVTSPGFVVNLSGMASGIYLVSVKSSAGTYSKKIVVAQ